MPLSDTNSDQYVTQAGPERPNRSAEMIYLQQRQSITKVPKKERLNDESTEKIKIYPIIFVLFCEKCLIFVLPLYSIESAQLS